MKIEKVNVYNIIPAVKHARLSYDSLEKSDSTKNELGVKDYQLAMKLIKSGSSHRKFLRQIFVGALIKAPWYWWKEYATYKIGTTENSSSMMHTLTNRELTVDDFEMHRVTEGKRELLKYLNNLIKSYNRIEDKEEQKRLEKDIFEIVPPSFIYKRYATLNYEVLRNIYHQRKDHKLDEWHKFCDWVKTLPYNEFITKGGE